MKVFVLSLYLGTIRHNILNTDNGWNFPLI